MKGKWTCLLMAAVLAVGAVFSAACAEEKEEAAVTATSAATEASSPEASITAEAAPTGTPGPTPIPGSQSPFTVDGFEVQITEAGPNESLEGWVFGIPDLPPDAKVLGIRIAVLSGDAESFSKLDAWVSDENGREAAAEGTTITEPSDTSKPAKVTWRFAVPKTSQTFLLHFP
jgi:hypothetical protein